MSAKLFRPGDLFATTGTPQPYVVLRCEAIAPERALVRFASLCAECHSRFEFNAIFKRPLPRYLDRRCQLHSKKGEKAHPDFSAELVECFLVNERKRHARRRRSRRGKPRMPQASIPEARLPPVAPDTSSPAFPVSLEALLE